LQQVKSSEYQYGILLVEADTVADLRVYVKY